MTDDLIPNTGSAWATAQPGGDIPRSRREDVYQPPVSLAEFIRWHGSRDYIDVSEKVRLSQRVSEFNQSKGQER